MILTQLLKKFFNIKPIWVPTIALILGLLISIFISHRHNFLAGLFMGWFYGYAAIGSFASLKTTIIAYRNKKISNSDNQKVVNLYKTFLSNK